MGKWNSESEVGKQY